MKARGSGTETGRGSEPVRTGGYGAAIKKKARAGTWAFPKIA